MPRDIELISKELSEEHICVPGSPFWNVLKRFGLDELVAMVINVSATFIVSIFVGSLFFFLWLVQ